MFRTASLCLWVTLTLLAMPWIAISASAQQSGDPLVLHTRKLAIQTEGLTLQGTLSIPASGKPRYPTVLLIPGSGPTNRDGNQPPVLISDLMKKIAFSLARAGIASYRYDKRVVGQTLPSDPAKLAEFARWENFVSDAAAAYGTLQSQPEIDGERIAILGHSEGAMLALEVAARLDQGNKPPAALVLAAGPGRRMDVILREQLAALGERQGGGAAAKAALADVDRAIAAIKATGAPPTDLPMNVAPLFPAYLGPFYRSYFAVDTPALAQRYKGPVLLIYGTHDVQVSSTTDAGPLDAALTARAGDEHQLLRAEGVSHNLKVTKSVSEPGIVGSLAPQVSRQLREWLGKRFQLAPPPETGGVENEP